MIISPDIIAKIKRGNTSLKNSVFKDLESVINNAKKKYEKTITPDKIDELANKVYDRCISTFDFPEQNFQLFFSKELNKEISSLKKEPIKENTISEKIITSPSSNSSKTLNFENTITPQMIFQIRNGDTSLKYDLLVELMPTINSFRKRYENKITSSQYNELANQVLEKCLIEFDFSEQNFSLFFIKMLSEEILLIIKDSLDDKQNNDHESDLKEKNSTLTNNKKASKTPKPAKDSAKIDHKKIDDPKDIIEDDKPDIIEEANRISELINNSELCCDIDKIANKLLSLIPEFKKIDPEDLYFVLTILVDNNERIQIYLKALISANYKFDNEILKMLINIKSNDNLNEFKGVDSFRTYLAEISRYPLLSAEEEKELFIRYYNGDERAKELLIKSNLRLVIYVAKNYLNQGTDIMDLIQEGNLGLIRAVEKYDFSQSKFSSYAYIWINSKIKYALKTYGNTIRIPHDKIDKYKKDIRTISQKEMEIGRKLTQEEIERITKLDYQTILLFNSILDHSLVSLDEAIQDKYGNDTEKKIQIPDQNSDTENEVFDQILKEKIWECLYSSNLSERQIEIVLLRFGFNNKKPITLEEIGKKMGLSRERIRVILNQAIKKLQIKLKSEIEISDEVKTLEKPIDKKPKITSEPPKNNISELQKQFFNLSYEEKVAFVNKMITNKQIIFSKEKIADILGIPIDEVDHLIGEAIMTFENESGDYSLHL